MINPEGCGGGSKCPYGFLIGFHFSQDHAMVTKILDFINKHPKLKVVKSFSYYLYRFYRNLAETDEKLQIFWSENREMDFFISRPAQHCGRSLSWSKINWIISAWWIIYTTIGIVRCTLGVGIVSITTKPYIPHKSLLQWICCKCIAWWHRHSYFWPQRSWRLLEAINTPRQGM